MVAIMDAITTADHKEWLVPWAQRPKADSEMQMPVGHLERTETGSVHHEAPDFPFCFIKIWEGGSLGGGRNEAVLVFGSFLVPTNALNIFHFLSAFVQQL